MYLDVKVEEAFGGDFAGERSKLIPAKLPVNLVV